MHESARVRGRQIGARIGSALPCAAGRRGPEDLGPEDLQPGMAELQQVLAAPMEAAATGTTEPPLAAAGGSHARGRGRGRGARAGGGAQGSGSEICFGAELSPMTADKHGSPRPRENDKGILQQLCENCRLGVWIPVSLHCVTQNATGAAALTNAGRNRWKEHAYRVVNNGGEGKGAVGAQFIVWHTAEGAAAYLASGEGIEMDQSALQQWKHEAEGSKVYLQWNTNTTNFRAVPASAEAGAHTSGGGRSRCRHRQQARTLSRHSN